MDFVSASLIAILFSLILLWVRRRKEHFSVFKRNGIPGPEPSFWTGNYKEFASLKEACVEEFVKKYGNIVGFFLGAKPLLIVTDPELMRLIQVKEFSKFTDRELILPDAGIPQPVVLLSLFSSQGEEWKKKRSLISPSFSTSKLKRVMPILNEAGDIFMEKIDKSCNDEYVNVVELFKNLSLDVITKTALGIDTGVQHSADSKLLNSARLFLSPDATDILPAISMCLPELEPIPTKLRNLIDNARYAFGLTSVKNVYKQARDVVKYRRKFPQKRGDILQGLMEEKADLKSLLSTRVEDLAASSGNKEESNAEQKTQDSNLGENFSLSDENVVASAVNLVIAGFDTTSTTLCFLAYYLSKHQNVQDRVREEINNQVEQRKEITYDDLSKFPYMEQVISETLRLHSTNMVTINRVAAESMKYENMTIPKGIAVIIPSTYLQRNPENWPDPEKFDPERFSPENKSSLNSGIYQPFGFGPRNCVGMRFAMIVMKLMLARLLRSYRLKSYADNEPKVEYAIVISQVKEVLVKLERV